MRAGRVSIVVAVIVLLMLAVGVAGAFQGVDGPVAPAGGVADGINYQGRLTNPAGSPLSGTYTMRFILYTQSVGGSAVWDSGNRSVDVDSGLFNVKLDVDQADFDGQALWLSLIVGGQTLSPRQEILPAPYALGLRPGADIVGDSIGAGDATLAGYAPATGTALYADANGGTGLFGGSENSYGVWGSSNNSWGGFFTSSRGYGIRVDTSGTDHYDHGAYITSNGGFGVYAQSSSNQGVRGEAGDISGLSQPLGPVGVVGIGASRGLFGASGDGIGGYGTSVSSYGLWGQSSTYRGVTGRTSRADNNYGFYTPDNFYSLNINFAGAVMQVMRNGGSEPLSPGDVVLFSGVDREVSGVDAPVVRVRQADAAHSSAVAGVVYSRFNIRAIDPTLDNPEGGTENALAALEVTPAGSAQPGDYVLVVVQGPAEVRVDPAASGSIQPGDVLATAAGAGMAQRAATVTMNGLEVALPGTIFAKALEAADGKREMIYVYVTLQ